MTTPTPRSTIATRLMLGGATLLVGLLAFVPPASAARDPIAGGTTDLHLKTGFARKLNNAQIAIAGVGNGIAAGNKASLKVTTGKFDPTKTEGFLESEGGFKFVRANRAAPITGLNVNTVKGSVYAVVAKAHMQFATFVNPVGAREGFGANLKAGQLALTAKAATRISNSLGLKGNQRIEAGRVLSNLYATEQPETVTILPTGTATLTANTATLGKFKTKGVELPQGITPIAPATQPAATTFAFPISGGTVAPDATSGAVNTTGGVQILKKAKSYSPTVVMKNIIVDFKEKTATVELELLPAPPFPGAVGRSSIVTIALAPGSVVANPTARTIAINGATAALQATAASTLNSVFNQPAPEPPPASNFVVGDPLGTFAMTLQAQ
jgi:hypothetical protein